MEYKEKESRNGVDEKNKGGGGKVQEITIFESKKESNPSTI